MQIENKGEFPSKGRRLLVLGLTANGVVYGDNGTSPLYVIRETFHASYGPEIAPTNVLGAGHFLHRSGTEIEL